MRNRFGGDCYKCGLWVAPGTGHFERHKNRWRTQHGLHAGQGRVTCNEASKKEKHNEAQEGKVSIGIREAAWKTP